MSSTRSIRTSLRFTRPAQVVIALLTAGSLLAGTPAPAQAAGSVAVAGPRCAPGFHRADDSVSFLGHTKLVKGIDVDLGVVLTDTACVNDRRVQPGTTRLTVTGWVSTSLPGVHGKVTAVGAQKVTQVGARQRLDYQFVVTVYVWLPAIGEKPSVRSVGTKTMWLAANGELSNERGRPYPTVIPFTV